MPATIAIVGRSNSGKTTLIERLIPLLKRQGCRVGTLKHDAHGFEIDRPGKDTWRHREAGAETVVISGPTMLALVRRLEAPVEPAALIATYFDGFDLVLVEGFKQFEFPKLEVVRHAVSQAPMCPPESLAGLVTDCPLAYPGVPTYALDDAPAIAERVLALAAIAGHG